MQKKVAKVFLWRRLNEWVASRNQSPTEIAKRFGGNAKNGKNAKTCAEKIRRSTSSNPNQSPTEIAKRFGEIAKISEMKRVRIEKG